MFRSTQLRPLNIGEILDAAFRLYRAHLVTFLGITALITQIGVILAGPLQLCTYTLLYYDQRVRREGLDIEPHAQTGEAALA